MPHLTGVFEEFPDLDKVTPGEISSWLRSKPETHVLVNFFGNRLLYPQTIATNHEELEIDFAILREGIKQKPDLVYDAKGNKVFLPQLFLDRFPSLPRLAGAIIEALNPKGEVQIYIKDKSTVKIAGTLISPTDIEQLSKDKKTVKIEVNGVLSTLNINTLSISPINQAEVKIKIGDKSYKVIGGVLGIIIDLRLKSND